MENTLTETENVSVKDLARFTKNAIDAKDANREKGKKYLVIPPIQRGLVWRNEQIINYWDSLFRGFPPGMMLYYKEPPKSDKPSTNANYKEMYDDKDDLHLFDGQQRLNAILLGFGYLENSDKKLWIDLGKFNNDNIPILRISSIGQPFGYKTDKPNERFEVSKRREKSSDFKNKTLFKIFQEVKNEHIIDAEYCIELPCFLSFILNETEDTFVLNRIIKTFKIEEKNFDKILHLIKRARVALAATIIFHYPEILKPINTARNSNDMLLFFERVGRGGTALSGEEQIYSKIKFHYPIIRERMTSIMKPFKQGGVGRIIDETDLVMSALRISFAIDKEEKYSRPVPSSFNNIQINKDKENEYKIFKELFHEIDGTFLYLDILIKLREKLEFNNDNNKKGLPVLLLSKLDKHLIDVLVLIGYFIEKSNKWTKDDLSATLITFVLYWLVFHKSNKQKNMADIAYKFTGKKNGKSFNFNQEFLNELIGEFNDDVAFSLNYLTNIHALYQDDNFKMEKIKGTNDWKHFISYNGETASEAYLNFLFEITYRERKKSLIIWLEREYLSKNSYDLTSSIDEELPFDLDHIIPQARWNDKHMTKIKSKYKKENKYKTVLSVVGNSIGNLKYLNFADNRAKSDDLLKCDYFEKACFKKYDDDGKEWVDVDNYLNEWDSEQSESSNDDNLDRFKSLIGKRSFNMLEDFFSESGISNIKLKELVNEAD